MNIIDKIKEAQNAYYNSEPIMTDKEFDILWDTAQKEFPDNEIFRKVGEDDSSDFEKMKHLIPMGSQAKCTTKEQLKKFLSSNGTDYIVEDKCDGISVELIYNKGKFVNAITRGNGTIGDNITSNVSKMKGFPKNVDNFTGSVRGEILLFKSDKDKYFPDLKNCRNAASGIAKRKDGTNCEYLTIVCYDVRSNETKFETEDEVISFLKLNNFKTVWSMRLKKANEDKIFEILSERFSENVEYDIDGIVIKKNVIDYEDQNTNVRPKTNIALKPAYNTAESKIVDIKWNMSNGTLTPVAVFEPVVIDGARITQASLSNVALMEQMCIEIGKRVLVSRRNMVIPHIEKVL